MSIQVKNEKANRNVDLEEQILLLKELGAVPKVHKLKDILYAQMSHPIYGITITRSVDPHVPTFALIGGVHGLETIGTSVILSYLRTMNRYLNWDLGLQEFLTKVKLVFLPALNPVGAYLGQRANGNGVDLMRNGPLDSSESMSSLHIYRGHRTTPFLPWYRGKAGQPMESESQVLIDFIEREVFPSRFAICMDVHSGFGAVDRLWFPYARKKEFFPDVASALSLKELLDSTLPNHVYKMEPQSVSYTVHGDLWDYLYERHREHYPQNVFLPLTLEMGSWNWVKKNPFQILSRHGIFHPIKKHRISRVLRRHSPLFDFLGKATAAFETWLPSSSGEKIALEKRAADLWQR